VRAKTVQKAEAIELRKKGLSYSEILDEIHVSGSSLSLWLHNVNLKNEHKLRLIEKGDAARRLGSATLKRMRIMRTKEIVERSRLEIGNLSKNDLMLIGVSLHWAEGSKQKENDPSKEVVFSNSDPRMIKIYLKWLNECLGIHPGEIVFEIYIHETHKKSIAELASYWSKVTEFPILKFSKVYFKKNKVHSFRKNRGLNYSGVLRISVRKSTDLNRKIMGWIEGICLQSGVA